MKNIQLRHKDIFSLKCCILEANLSRYSALSSHRLAAKKLSSLARHLVTSSHLQLRATHIKTHTHTHIWCMCAADGFFLGHQQGGFSFSFFFFALVQTPLSTLLLSTVIYSLNSYIKHTDVKTTRKTTEAVSFTGLREAAMSISASSPQFKTVNQSCYKYFGLYQHILFLRRGIFHLRFQ